MAAELPPEQIAATVDLPFVLQNGNAVLGTTASGFLVRALSDIQRGVCSSNVPMRDGAGYLEVQVQSLPVLPAAFQMVVGFNRVAPTDENLPGEDANSCGFHVHTATMHSKGTTYDSVAHVYSIGSVIGIGTTIPNPMTRRRIYFITFNGRVVHSGPLTIDTPHLVIVVRGMGLSCSVNTAGPFRFAADHEGRAERDVTFDSPSIGAPIPAASLQAGGRAPSRSALLSDIQRARQPAAVAEATAHPRHANVGRIGLTGSSSVVSGPNDAATSRSAANFERPIHAIESAISELRSEVAILTAERDALSRRARDAEERIQKTKLDEFEVLQHKMELYRGDTKAVARCSDVDLEHAVVTLSSALGQLQEEKCRRERCIICMDARRSILYLPCKHFCVCRTCHPSIRSCPMCRATVTDHVALFE